MTFSEVAEILLSAALTAAVGYSLKAVRHSLKLFRITQLAQQAVIKDRIVSIHADSMRRRQVDSYTLATAEELYSSYAELGGNGFVHTLMHDIRQLPVTTGHKEVAE